MTEEFLKVTRKKWLARRNRIPRSSMANSGEYQGEINVDNFLKRLQELQHQMRNSQYFLQAIAVVEQSLAELPQNLRHPSRIVCLGIGPFTRSFQALHQLVFILEAQKHWVIKESFYYDPVFRNNEKEVLERLGCRLLPSNSEGKHEADVLTLFYLPHCPTRLTNNLLWRNWEPLLLQNILLINNSFDSMATTHTEKTLRSNGGFLLDVLPYAKEFELEDIYKTQGVFNDLSVHVFPLVALPSSDEDFWRQLSAPHYDSDDDLVREMQKLDV